MFNGTALWKDEIYGWAIKEKLERKIYNFPLKPVIHVVNIDVISEGNNFLLFFLLSFFAKSFMYVPTV